MDVFARCHCRSILNRFDDGFQRKQCRGRGEVWKSLYYFTRQLFLILGFILMLFIINVNIIKYQNRNDRVSGLFALLLLVLMPGIGKTRGGARSWIAIRNFSIQPSEFMKLGLAGIYAKYLGAHYRDMKSLKNFLLLFSLAVVVFLIIMLQPDFGTGLVIVVSAGLMIYRRRAGEILRHHRLHRAFRGRISDIERSLQNQKESWPSSTPGKISWGAVFQGINPFCHHPEGLFRAWFQ